MASHGSGRATLSSLKADIAILAASGAEWNARIRRLAARVPAIDIFGNGHVLRQDDGWEITAKGRDFLALLEAVSQDNLPPGPDEAAPLTETVRGDLIVVGHRFKNRIHRRRGPACAFPGEGMARGENALK